MPWNQALPDGYVGTLAAALVFGAAWIADASFWAPFVARNQIGLQALFTPPHLVEIAAAAVMVSGPVRAAARRGEATASAVPLMSVALLLSVLTFATQFAHPLIDPWAAKSFQYRLDLQAIGLSWVADNLGVASILAQSAILVATGLLLNSSFHLRFGSLTFVFRHQRSVCRNHQADVRAAPSRDPDRACGRCMALVGPALARAPRRIAWARSSAAAFSLLSLLAIALLPGGLAWSFSLASAIVLAAMLLGWLMGRLLPAGLPFAMVLLPTTIPGEPPEVHWTRDPESVDPAPAGENGARRPRNAREAWSQPAGLTARRLARRLGRERPSRAAGRCDRRAFGVDPSRHATPKPATCSSTTTCRRVGSHEVIMERLHLSRPTFYRRLQRGFALVAERLDEMSEFAHRVPVKD